IPGVGTHTADKIAALLDTGRLPYYDELRAKTPVDLAGLSAIEGLGPKMIKALYDQLGVKTVDDLEAAAQAGKVRRLPHFGEKSEQKILKGIAFVKQRAGRVPLGDAWPLMHELAERLRAVRGVARIEVAGSIRRRRETIGDGDLLAVSHEPERVMDALAGLPEVADVIAHGPAKTSVKLRSGMDVDMRVVPAESFGAALLYFTGSKAHNIALRKLAIAKGLKLSEYGVFRGKRAVAGLTEEDVYAALGLPYIPPELREDAGEVEAGLAGTLPDLIGYDDLRGDLQTQTDWTDGADSIAAMAAAARRRGLEYIAITDHTKGLAMTNGSDEKKLRKQMAAIDALNAEGPGIAILKGAEVNINKDGTLDIDDATLAMLDVVGVAVHAHFHLPRAEQTRRVIRAMENPHADILFHPTGRLIGKREAYDIDIDAVIAAAKRTGTVLEIDAFPDRMDLKDDHARKAASAGVKLVIDSDAHATGHFQVLHYGIAAARRGWVTKADVINTRPLREFLRALKGA
ncbi:MAG TPA: DNA polymerase/3'-5' exonuclease PolX, partial [Nitrospiria bacterium]|nr:DNA polymerase/3'-5' exonuclease PolX [Nitrospiria bacterium]